MNIIEFAIARGEKSFGQNNFNLKITTIDGETYTAKPNEIEYIDITMIAFDSPYSPAHGFCVVKTGYITAVVAEKVNRT